MNYADLVAVYEDLQETSATLEKTAILEEALRSADDQHLPVVVTMIQGRVFPSWQSVELGVSTSLTTEAIAKATGIGQDQITDWWRDEGDLGDAAARAVAERTQRTLFSDPLTAERVHDTLRELAQYEGQGSQARRIDAIAGLISDADPLEAKYIVRTILGAMRLGVGDGLVRDAIARAYLDGSDASIEAVGRAYDVTNDFVEVATRAKAGGRQALLDLDIELFRPIKPMLAQQADDLQTALADLADDAGEVLLETKYDGIRAKIHKVGTDIRLFTRRLEEVTTQFPDVIDATEAAIRADSVIIEAEVVGYDPADGEIVPFQQLSQRIKRKYDIDKMAAEIPVTVYLFDLLYLDGESLLSEPLRSRLEDLDAVFDRQTHSVERAHNRRVRTLDDAADFYDEVVAAGHEGVMAKNLDATYQPGSRVGYQQKVKPTMDPLDLVVTRAKWSEGRKQGFLGRPYLACVDERNGSFREVGRMHTGFSDDQLAEFTDLVEPLIRDVEGREATFDPQVVVSVEYEEIQTSTKYDSGYALRFPRLREIRTDLGPNDADTLATVKSLYRNQT